MSEHTIDTGTSQPIKQPPRRTPPHQREIIDLQLDDLLKHGRIEPSQSPWNSPVVLARKHDGTFRMCVDYRWLNQCTVKDAQPLPRSDVVLEAVGGALWFSSLIRLLANAGSSQRSTKDCIFHSQSPVSMESGPLGLTNGPASFTR